MPRLAGEQHPRHKITREQARAISVDTRRGAIIAAEYGISEALVSNIRTGKAWARTPNGTGHLNADAPRNSGAREQVTSPCVAQGTGNPVGWWCHGVPAFPSAEGDEDGRDRDPFAESGEESEDADG
ncbi:MAG: hypothetical protein KGL39_09080 [Patescibacteria group bacterium]|nr:hypothetical protein [Patescibacteria group bacterium]